MPVGVDNEDVERSLCAGELRGQFLDFRIGISPVAAVPVSERIMRGKRLTAEQFRTAPQRGFVVMPESEEIKATAFPNVAAAAICFSPRTRPVVFMIPGTVPAVFWKSNWKKMSVCHSVASLRLTMMAVMATPSGKFTVAVLICGVIMPSN